MKFVTTLSNLIEFYCEAFLSVNCSLLSFSDAFDVEESKKIQLKFPDKARYLSLASRSRSFRQVSFLHSRVLVKEIATSCMSKHFLDPSLQDFFAGVEQEKKVSSVVTSVEYQKV